MSKSIDAMKHALDIISRTTSSAFVKTMLEEAIAAEEAQTLGCVGQRVNSVTLGHPIVWFKEIEPGTMLFTHPAQGN